MTDVVAGRYVLVDPIGAGGFGTVWRAFDRKTGRYCAAKLLRQRDAGELLRFVREQSVRLAHPNIVSPYSWAAEDGTVLIASELVAGGSVHTLLGDFGPLAEGTVVTMVRQLLSALGAVHDAELIHRDVKPANLLLHATGTGPIRLALTDFGLTISRRDARLTQVGMVVGTPGYLPPEVLRGGIPPDPRHDLYAVGRLTLTLLAGQEPDGPAAASITVIRDPALRDAVAALMRPDPDERPADVAAALELLSPARADRTPHARDGEPIDVLNQLPDLPDGWGRDGPVPSSATPPVPSPRATVVDVAATSPDPIPDPIPAAATEPAAPTEPAAATESTEATEPAAGGVRRGPRRRVIVGAAAAVAVVVAGVVVVPKLTSGPTDPPPTPPTTSTTTVPSPTTTVAPTSATLRAGDPCTWQQEGDRQGGVDGPVVCTVDDGTYQWRVP